MFMPAGSVLPGPFMPQMVPQQAPQQQMQPKSDPNIAHLSEMVKLLCEKQSYTDTQISSVIAHLQNQQATSATSAGSGMAPSTPSVPNGQPSPATPPPPTPIGGTVTPPRQGAPIEVLPSQLPKEETDAVPKQEPPTPVASPTEVAEDPYNAKVKDEEMGEEKEEIAGPPDLSAPFLSPTQPFFPGAPTQEDALLQPVGGGPEAKSPPRKEARVM